MGLHRKGGKTVKKRSSRNNKKGGSFGALMSQLAAPVVLFSANHLYGKKTRRNNKRCNCKKRNCKKCNKKSAKRSRRFLSRRRR